jgi:hypothetical protein
MAAPMVGTMKRNELAMSNLGRKEIPYHDQQACAVLLLHPLPIFYQALSQASCRLVGGRNCQQSLALLDLKRQGIQIRSIACNQTYELKP